MPVFECYNSEAFAWTWEVAGTLIGVEDRALTFEVTCSDAAGVIGKGVHRRFIVDGARFAAKAQSKAQKQA